MQGIFIDGKRPVSKKALKLAIAETPERVRFEATSYFGDEYDGRADRLPVGHEVYFCGPDVYRDRRFYGTVRYGRDGRLTVK